MSNPAFTERHLAMLDDLAELGMDVIHRHCEGPPQPGQDQPRDFLTLSGAIRRTILLFHLIETGKLPQPRPAAEAPKTVAETPPAAVPQAARDTKPPAKPRSDDRTRLDTLDDVSGPFHQTVAAIIRDIRSVLPLQPAIATREPGARPPAAAPNPTAPRRDNPGITPERPEADVPDLN